MADLPEKDFEDWVQAPDAFKRAHEKYGNIGDAAEVLFKRLKDGLLYSAAADLVAGNSRSKFVFVKVEHWNALEYLRSGDSFWTTGEIAIKVGLYRPHDRQGIEYGYYDVRFNRPQIDKLLGPVQLPAPEEAQSVEAIEETERANRPPVSAAKGGRPPKAFWEALWIEMAAQVWAGDIGPESKQAAIQDAMEEWAVANGEDASPATFKNAARALLQGLIAKKGKNLK